MIDFSKLDKVIHEKARLGIVTLLASRSDPWPFQDLKAELQMSDGNLITHLRTLGKAGYVYAEKVEGESRPQTYYELTGAGRKAFEQYLEILEAILDLGKE
ncbi:MAG: ArsR family transcriptional regulator [Akkermansiaceae bacterium]|nr:ArsR family transcriptional regulator [Akkermansiaceae bacterium]